MYNRDTVEVIYMFNQVLKEQLIDIEGLFLLHYHELHINEIQAMIILLTLRLERNHIAYITPKLLAQYMSVNEKTVDQAVISLMNQQLLSFENNSISTRPLLDALCKIGYCQEPKEEQVTKVNLVEVFEKEFGRGLTPIEIEILKEWKQCQYKDDMILDALKEATLSNVRNMRYIEKILIEWAKHGVKRSGRDSVHATQKPIELVEYEWWND